MRVLLVAFPLKAHLYNMVPLAWALQSAGHEVRVAGQAGMTDESVAGMIASVGLAAVPLGGKEDLAPLSQARREGELAELRPDALAVDYTDGQSWKQNRRSMATQFAMTYPVESLPEGSRPYVDHLVDFARSWQPDLVIWDTICFPAAIAARETGAAHARFLWGLDNVGWVRSKSQEELSRLGSDCTEDPLVTWMQPMLTRYGYEFKEEFLLGQWSITQAPPAMRLPLDLPHVSVRGVPYNGPGVAPAWLLEDSERPRVCLSLGVTGRLRAGSGTAGVDVPLADLLDMVAEVDAEVVATVNAAQLSEVGRLPDNVRTIDYVPLSLLLPTCSAIVHHGGAGTYATAVAHQVPQLIIPVPKWDEPTLAGHVADRGAGLVVDLEKLSVETMRSQLVRILDDPSFRAGARTLYRESLASPSPRDIVPVLEKLTAQYRA